MLYYVYFSDEGSPKASLSPDWDSLITAENGTDRSGDKPTITEGGGAGNGGGWYKFDITFGTAPWQTETEDLLGVIDGGSALGDADRYKPVCITLRGLGLARIAHKGVQNKSTGDIDLYATDGTSKEMKLDMTDGSSEITRTPGAPS